MPELTIERPKFKERDYLNSLIIFLLKLAVFFIPLWFWPFSFEAFEFGKQNLLWFLTGLAAIIWLIKSIVIDKKIVYQRTPLDLPILIMLLVWALSVIFSVDRFSSLFGYYGRFSDAFLTTVSLALFYWLATQAISRGQIAKFFNVFIASVSLALLIGLLSLSKALVKLPATPGLSEILSSNAFNPAGGSMESLALLAAAALVLAVALYSYNIKGEQKRPLENIKYYFLFGLSLAVLALVNFSLSWLGAIIGLGAVFSFALYVAYLNKEDAAAATIEIAIAPALILFMGSILLLFIASGTGGLNIYKLIWRSNVPQEIVLPAAQSNAIIWQTVKSRPLLGSGPGTFAYDFSLQRPADFNNWQFWQLRFDKAPVHITELLATVGVLGALSYFALVGIWLFVSFVFLKNMFRSDSEASYLAFGFTFAAFTLFISQSLYLFNTTLNFVFWFALAMAFINWRVVFEKIFSTREIDLAQYKEVAPVIAGLVIAGVGLWLWFSYTQARFWLADTAYNDFRLSGSRERLLQAVKLNPRRLNYHLALAKDYVNEVKEDIVLLSTPDKSGTITAESKAKLQTNIQQALKEGQAATAVAPNSVMAWETLGATYRDIRLIAVGSLAPAIRYLTKASELEPTNPVLLTELGKLYLANGQTKEAADAFEQAAKFKSDYWEAQVGLAQTYDSLGESDKALVILEDLISRQPNADVIYESGRLYYNQGKLDKAIERFTQAIALRPSYANAIYSLGLAYQKQGDKTRALAEFQKVLELNPGNETVKKMMEEINQQKQGDDEMEIKQ